MHRPYLVLLLGGLFLSAARAAAPTPELPVSTFFQAPSITALSFSPSGKYLACLVPWERRMNLAVIDLEKGTKNLLTNFKDRQATAPVWANDDRILFRVDDDGKESFSLYAIDRDGKDPVVLAGGYDTYGSESGVNVRFRSILRRMQSDAGGILVLANLTHIDWSDVARMSLKSGNMEVLARAPGQVDFYVLDHRDQVRFAVVIEGQKRKVLHRESNGGDWEVVAERHVDGHGWEPIAFDGDNRTVLIWSDVGRKTKAIYRYDPVARKQLEQVFADDTYDAVEANTVVNGTGSSVLYDGSRKKVVGISYSADRTRIHWLDDDMRRLQAKLDASLPDTVHRPRQFSADGSRIVFFSSSDRDPGVYYLYDRKRDKLSEIAVLKPAIEPDKMAATRAIHFEARDGLTVHGYLTLPNGREAKGLPMVLHPHGGPFGIRDEWGYRDEV